MRTATSFLLFLLPFVAVANHQARDHHLNRRHRQHAGLTRRDRATFYDVGLGACGKTNVASDFVIALNVGQYAGGAHCFQMVTISYQGKTTQAQVVDECMGCPGGGIDMSRGLFDFFASESQGVIDVTWSFGGGGGGGGGGAAPSPSPSPSSTPPPWSASPTSTWTPPKPTTTKAASKSTTSATKTSSATTSSSTLSATNATDAPQNLADLSSLIGAFGKLVSSAAQ